MGLNGFIGSLHPHFVKMIRRLKIIYEMDDKHIV
jgi:hypothetical protein